MTFTRREINLRYNLKNADRLCENAISYYHANKERISARRREIYAEKKAQAILESEERQRILAGYTEITVLKQFFRWRRQTDGNRLASNYSHYYVKTPICCLKI